MRIVPKAVAVCRHGDRVLVERGYDASCGKHFYRAIGGRVEFGERAADALSREWREEFGLRLEEVRLLGVLENLFTYEGRSEHEIVFVFAARIADAHAYDRDELASVEAGHEPAVWVPVAELAAGGVPLHPDGILALVEAPTRLA
ncbi:MAG TPA: NUDIX domain-containing protein [Longimicrobiaceae bacterium]|nr:NUDIX domain-containing protein [Longimicrobiaceae bacterium]